MSEPTCTCGFRGWVKVVVVIAALLTITNGIYDGVKGFIAGLKDSASAIEHTNKK